MRLKDRLACVHELALWAEGCGVVAGVDEVGRGPLAGPVLAAAVVVPDNPDLREFLLREAGDSKQLKAAKREELAVVIERECVVGVGEASVAEIDELNIRRASLLAMARAIAGLPGDRMTGLPDKRINGVVVDGNVLIPAEFLAGISVMQRVVIGGDACELAVACASIVAKVRRDALMVALDAEFPGYGWARNAGYGTAAHMEGLVRLGVTVHHRRTFAPIRNQVARNQVARGREAA
ncbi:MAG: ribonuclease HII [Proteobacteria bacterium]|nr:ribonuclease HII [Pseudomonadota bacterium]